MSGNHQPALPPSLAPHIAVLPSDDLVQLLAESNLPPLQYLLQSFSPLSQVTTRTSSLLTIAHNVFHVRFSDLVAVENACKEDQETRASRMIDWLSSRVMENASSWIKDLETCPPASTTPWWQDIRECVGGDWMPIPTEVWNHPIALVLAVSTHGPNPLQAVELLHSRSTQLPPWVEPDILRYTLIIHSDTSPLTSEESAALFNAVKRQHGQYTYLLTLSLSSNLPSNSIPLTPDPRASHLPDPSSSHTSANLDSFKISQQNFTETNKFVRELVASSLVPLMESLVVDWSETYPSARRLPSRLFSSTRRLFGTSASVSPSLAPQISKSQHYQHTATNAAIPTANTSASPYARRLAQFATLLGDTKLAVSVWENLRKEGLGGSDILPLLLAPSPALLAYVSHALQALRLSEPSAMSQLLSLRYVLRWEASVPEFLSREVGGESWLAWAASSSDEVTSALMLGQAALLKERVDTKPSRRAGMWYVTAADRLEKSGIPIRMYLLRRAREIYLSGNISRFSPVFRDAEFFGKNEESSLSDIITHVEHSLGRIHYTLGETEIAVELLLSLFRQTGSPALQDLTIDDNAQLQLEDFRSVFEHMLSTPSSTLEPKIYLPLSFCLTEKIKIRGIETDVEQKEWTEHSAIWRRFSRLQGMNAIDFTVKAQVEEKLCVDITLRNPMSIDVVLSGLTLQVQEQQSSNVTVNTIAQVTLPALLDTTISFNIVAHVPMVCELRQLVYKFLDLVPCSESLAMGGRRLNDNPGQMRGVVYAPASFPGLEVENSRLRLDAEMSGIDTRSLLSGECLSAVVTLKSTGRETIRRLWLLHAGSERSWATCGSPDGYRINADSQETKFQITNELYDLMPIEIPLQNGSPSLETGDTFQLPLSIHVGQSGNCSLKLWFVYSSASGRVRPTADAELAYQLDVAIENASAETDINVVLVSSLSPLWSSRLRVNKDSKLHPRSLFAGQSMTLNSCCSAVPDGAGGSLTSIFANAAISRALSEAPTPLLDPPCIELMHSVHHQFPTRLDHKPVDLILYNRWLAAKHQQRTSEQGGLLSVTSFPIVNVRELDLFVSWEIPEKQKLGFVLVTGLSLGAGHEELAETLSLIERPRISRAMYAESLSEKRHAARCFQHSVWNYNADPIVLVPRVAAIFAHNFSDGPAKIPVFFDLKNYSITSSVYFILYLGVAAEPVTRTLPAFIGSTRRQGNIKPLSVVHLRTYMWVESPGTYPVATWKLQIEVGDGTEQDYRLTHRFSQSSDAQEPIVFTAIHKANTTNLPLTTVPYMEST